MKIDDCFQLGNIIKSHGMKGEVSAIFDVDNPEEYLELESVFVLIDKKLVPFFIESLSFQNGYVLLKFEDINHPDDTERIKGCELYLPLSALPDLGEGKFYFHEVIGFAVVDAKEGHIGTIKEVYSLNQQDILSVDHQGAEVLVPLHDDFIEKVDKPGRTFYVKLPDGLLSIYLDSKA